MSLVNRDPKPKLRHIINLWSLVQYPSPKKEWSLERKLRAVKNAGFDGFTDLATPEHGRLADGYHQATGELLPMTWDFSHLALVKHLAPPFWERLIVRPDLIQRAQQFHFRPFNGHHGQVPVTDGHGRLSKELKDWMPFGEKILETWLKGPNALRSS